MGHERRELPYSNPEHLRLALEQLGPTFVKLGQILSTRSDLLPEPYREELAALQDSAPPVPAPIIAELIERELGRAPFEVFSAFLGQAHAATLSDGTEVVVKVRRPDVAEQVEQDLEILGNLAARASRHWVAAADYDLIGIAEPNSTISKRAATRNTSPRTSPPTKASIFPESTGRPPHRGS